MSGSYEHPVDAATALQMLAEGRALDLDAAGRPRAARLDAAVRNAAHALT
jgi:hypothetical protein